MENKYKITVFDKVVLGVAAFCVGILLAMSDTAEQDVQTSYEVKEAPYYPPVKDTPLVTFDDKAVKELVREVLISKSAILPSKLKFYTGDVITHTRRYRKGTVKRCTPYYCDVYLGKTEQRWFNNRIAERHVGK